MRTPLLMILATLVSFSALAETTQLSLALGASVPKDASGKTFVQKTALSRASGGEKITLRLGARKTVSAVKLVGYSKSGQGKALVRKATAFDGATATPVEALYVFAKAPLAGKPTNQNNLVLLTNGAFVDVAVGQTASRFELEVEGYSNNDASLLLQITFADGLQMEEFLVTRTGSDETTGAYANEAGYAKFSATQLTALLKVGVTPTAAQLSGKTYSCSSYSKQDPARVDFKTRAYFTDAEGNLKSTSLSQGPTGIWRMTEDGLALAFANRNGCGAYETRNVARITADGNLVAEVVMDLEGYIALCSSAGYDTSATRELVAFTTFPSILSPRYVVGVYEFCRPTGAQ